MSEPFPRIICLTLPEQRERHVAVVQQLESVGLRNYEFYPGFTPASDAVKAAYAADRVKRYPDCFRCGRRDCGRPHCNNILVPSQVAVALGFQAIFRSIVASEVPFAAVCEDDIVFAGCARALFASGRFRQLIEASGMLDEAPALLRLGRPSIDREFPSTDPARAADLHLTDTVVMSNYFFLANRSFARLAAARLDKIDHTADVIIHQSLSDRARCRTLNLQIVADRSFALGEISSLIHPKPHHLAYLTRKHGESAPQVLDEADRIRNHVKKAVSVPYAITGSPRCGSHFVSAFLRGNGIDIGHEKLGAAGICAWQFAVGSDSYPYISDTRAKSDFFVHADHWFLYARNPFRAIPSLLVENQHAPRSYSFRREAIYKHLKVNLDDFGSPVERAARSYAHWYQLALKRKPQAVLRVESFLQDCRQHLRDHEFQAVSVPAADAGAGKRYLGFAHKPPVLGEDSIAGLPADTLHLLQRVANELGYPLQSSG